MHRGSVMSDRFIDRQGNVVIAHGVAHLDFLHLDDFDAEKDQARLAPSIRLAIPVTVLVLAVNMPHKLRGTAATAAASYPIALRDGDCPSASKPANTSPRTTGPAGLRTD